MRVDEKSMSHCPHDTPLRCPPLIVRTTVLKTVHSRPCPCE